MLFRKWEVNQRALFSRRAPYRNVCLSGLYKQLLLSAAHHSFMFKKISKNFCKIWLPQKQTTIMGTGWPCGPGQADGSVFFSWWSIPTQTFLPRVKSRPKRSYPGSSNTNYKQKETPRTKPIILCLLKKEKIHSPILWQLSLGWYVKKE